MLFANVKREPEDPILSLPILFAAETNPSKVNLGIGSYKNEFGLPTVLSCVRKAEKMLLEQQLDKEYSPIQGLPAFLKETTKLVLGATPTHVSAIQTVGGTGALHLACDFLIRNQFTNLYLSDPTWANHFLIMEYTGMNVQTYPYYNGHTHQIKFDELCATIKKMPAHSIILLHACCHNPTGLDPTPEQWKLLSHIILKQKVLPFFDFAYQGFGDGLEQDAFAVKYFYEQGHEMLVASSFSKNLGLYGERVGMLLAVTKNSETAQSILTQLKRIVRSNYSVPPIHGARIAQMVMQDEKLKQEWMQELAQMRQRILQMRQNLISELKKFDLDLSFISSQKGIFSFTGLTSKQVTSLRQHFGIYMTENGRINVAGLTKQNVEYVAKAIANAQKVI